MDSKNTGVNATKEGFHMKHVYTQSAGGTISLEA